MSFIFKKLKITGVILIEPKFFPDKRGFFMETYKQSAFAESGIREKFVQENHSHSRQNVLRGLHYQTAPRAQAKLVRCVSGRIFDVAVDIRKNSPTYGKWVSAVLSDKNKKEILIPEGFAHGFCVLSKWAEIIYKTSKEYSPKHEKGIIWNDPNINIKWPVKKPLVSEKDSQWPGL
jgi:dTDP-4-dehydrorhamnose 3,5-epimerase